MRNGESDLTEAEQAEIRALFGALDQLTHYELLGVRRRETPDGIRRRFKALSLQWHPDAPRWRRRTLGAHASEIGAIFQRLRRAEEVLTDGERRAAYDAEYGHLVFDEEDIAALKERQRRPRGDRGRAERRVRRRRIPLPHAGYQRIALEADRRSREYEVVGNLQSALREAQTAELFARHRPKYAERARKLKAQVDRDRLELALSRAHTREKHGDWEGALSRYELVLKIEGEHAVALRRSAACLLAIDRDLDDALRRATKAARRAAGDADAHCTLAAAHAAMGNRAAARAACKRALVLDPQHEGARALWRKLWPWWAGPFSWPP